MFLTKARLYVDVTSSVRASSPSRWVDLRDWGRRVSFAFSLIVCFHPTNLGRAVLPYFFPYFAYSTPQSRLPGFFLLDFLSLPMRSTFYILSTISANFIQFHPTIKFTSSHSATHINFLDVQMTVKNRKLSTSIYRLTAVPLFKKLPSSAL